MCAGHGLGLMLIGVIVTIYFRQIKHHIHLPKVNRIQNVPSAIFVTLCHAECQHFYRTTCLTFSADSARKAPDGVLSTIGIDKWSTQRDKIQAETDYSDVSACILYLRSI